MDFKNKPIFGMIHLSTDEVDGTRVQRALKEMQILEEEGVDGIIIENYHGNVTDMQEVFEQLEDFFKTTKLIVGINILPNEFEQALRFADIYGAKFIQLDYVSGTYASFHSNKSISESEYNEQRNKYSHIKVLGGVWPKYYEPIQGSNLADDIETGKQRADAIVVTGPGTGKETPLDKIKKFKGHVGETPLIIGAGLTEANVAEQLTIADGAIVGSCFKPMGDTMRLTKRELVRQFMDEVIKVRACI